MSSLAKLISNFYKIKHLTMNIEQYNKLLLLYTKIKSSSEKYVNTPEWNGLYVYDKNNLPESPPMRNMVLKNILDMLNINYLDLILEFYKIIDNTYNIKKMPQDVINKLEFMIFILSKQTNTNFKIDDKTWKDMRSKCLIGRNKSKMPREPMTLGEIIRQVNSIISLN